MKNAAAFVSSLALVASVSAGPLAPLKRQSQITPITTKGNAFWQGDTRFYIRGVDWQPGGASGYEDPIADVESCQRDIQRFQQLGLNTVRVYTVDNSANHDQCMQMLADAGIYLALDVNSGKYSINRADPAPSYNDVYLQSVFATIDSFAKYPNTLLFFSANEVINNADNSHCAPYIKAVTRDMKQYISARNYRFIPVGYSAADVEQNRLQTALYMNCGADSARSDFFAFNDYSYCDTSFTDSGWSTKVQTYSNYSLPLFLSEYGCNAHPPRHFPEVADLYSTEMSAVYSGGLVYEFSEEPGNPNYGLVDITGADSTEIRPDFTNLMAMLQANPPPSGDGGYHMGGASGCPGTSDQWAVDTDELPVIPGPALAFMKDGAGPGPGLSGPGSQYAGTPSDGWALPSGSSPDGGSGGSSSSSSGSGSATSTGAAPTVRPPPLSAGPFAVAAIVALCTVMGATLL